MNGLFCDGDRLTLMQRGIGAIHTALHVGPRREIVSE